MLAFAVGLLKASIADLTGDSNNDGLPDAWQIQYFGSAEQSRRRAQCHARRRRHAQLDEVPPGPQSARCPASRHQGLSVGVVWANGNSLGNPYGATNTIQIYTAAEVAFNTVSGKTYQIQAASSISSGWQNIGYPIPGTGNSVSYVTPTRKNVQQFFRVYSY